MAWKRQYTSNSISVDVDLDEFDELELLQGLINAKWISETEAEAISKRAKTRDVKAIPMDADGAELSCALDCIRIGQKHEALIHLERFLGREFMGRLA